MLANTLTHTHISICLIDIVYVYIGTDKHTANILLVIAGIFSLKILIICYVQQMSEACIKLSSSRPFPTIKMPAFNQYGVAQCWFGLFSEMAHTRQTATKHTATAFARNQN